MNSQRTDSMRVRFAPSPTGFLHVGGARTALFNWLLVRRRGGRFVLRIEDTDRARSSHEMTAAILDGMRWLGLDWDEGPFFQAEGLARHQADARRILDADAGYRCFCTAAELEARRGEAGSYRYDRRCLAIPAAESERRAAAGEAYTIRFRVPAGSTTWDDAVYGSITFDNTDIEDFIILRTDRTPIYNLAVVSDDIEMGITHVLRGDDHISNTPKQILLYRALDRAVPVFAHVPMILGEDGKRLSKRHGATAVGEYQKQGILPEAMVNFLALLGWSPGTDEEIFTRDELIARFSMDGINRKSAIFDTRKLMWLNGQHLNRMPSATLAARVAPLLVEAGLGTAEQLASHAQWLESLLDLLKVRARSVTELVDQAKPYFGEDVDYDAEAVRTHWKDASAVADRLSRLAERWGSVHEWNEATLEEALRGLAAESGSGAGKFIHPLRVALVGSAVSPGIFEVAFVLGRERVLARIERAVRTLRDGPA